MQNVLDVLEKRGLVEIVTPDLREHLSTPRCIYVGIDPTADSLHLGNLIVVIVLDWFRKFGHTPYVILGGATSRIGDPGGKNKERPLLDEAVLRQNLVSIQKVFGQLFREEGPQPILLNNDDWFREMGLIDFLRDVGKIFRVGPMLAKESVRHRLESEEGISFTEFSYQLLQGYDFAYLHKMHHVTLQMGGSDQWGNITAGIEYNRKIGQSPIYGLSWPLLTRSDGKKFGKSEEGAIWLTADKLSPYHFYQYLVTVPDADVIRLLHLLTFLPLDTIASLEKEMREPNYVPNTAQKRLAEEVTRYVHGSEGVETALRVTASMAPGAKIALDEIAERLDELPSVQMERSQVLGCKLTELFVQAKMVASKSEAMRLIQQGGAYLNNDRMHDPGYTIALEDFISEEYLILGSGKKKRLIIRIT